MLSLFKIQPQSLQKRVALFVLVPVFSILVIMGFTGFIYTRDIILEQWGETAIAELQRAAHQIDMRLSRTKEMLLLIHNDSESYNSHLIHQFIIEQLKVMDGIVEVNVDWPKSTVFKNRQNKMGQGRFMRMQYSRMSKLRTSLPQFNSRFNSETISISSNFIDKNGQNVGQIEVVIEFHDLVDQILKAPWWKSNKAFIIDNDGNILSNTLLTENQHLHPKSSKFGKIDPLEVLTLKAIQKNSYGTIFGPGRPPDEISGYYHLNEAPWNIVIIAPGKLVLKPLIKFKTYYFLCGFLFILSIIIFIRMVLSKTTNAIKNVSKAAKNITMGEFGGQLPVQSKDEVGNLTENFNIMSRQLQERVKLKDEMNLAMEMQQNLLPPSNYSSHNLEISGLVIYCDETGGDYFDIINLPDSKEKICVAVGDVVGHGVGAALLMTTTRALLRSCLIQNSSLSKAITQVNQLLCEDTSTTGSFVTLFVMVIDMEKREIQWVRAGHDPAILYDPDSKEIIELKGEGLVLGLDETWNYSDNFYSEIKKGTSCIISTDGVWEVENSKKQRFGKNRVENILKKNTNTSAKKIIKMLTSEIEVFKGEVQQNDDITIVALKFN